MQREERGTSKRALGSAVPGAEELRQFCQQFKEENMKERKLKWQFPYVMGGLRKDL